MKLNLSRAAKKMRLQEPEQIPGPKPAQKVAASQPVPPKPAPEPAATAAEPVTAPPAPDAVAPEMPQPKKVWPPKPKRPRFVRAKAEKRARVAPAPLPPPSARPAARLMTKNLALPPKDDSNKPIR